MWREQFENEANKYGISIITYFFILALDRANLLAMLIIIIIIIIINIYIAQIPCEYDQMRVTNKYDTN